MWYTTSEIAQKWDITEAHVSRLCREGRIPGAAIIGGRWRIPEDAERPIKYVTAGFLTALETAKKWGISANRVEWMCLKGVLPNAKRGKRTWFIPEDTVNPWEEYITPSEIAKKWGISADKVEWMCLTGVLPDAKRGTRTWFIPEDTVNPREGYLTASEMAERWKLSRSTVSQFCKKGRISGAKMVGQRWYIPEDAEKPSDYRGKNK